MTISKRPDSCGNSHSDSPSPSVFGGADLGHEASVSLSLDTTGEWLSLRKHPCAKESAEGKQAKFSKEEKEAERKRLTRVFTDHAFQFLACADAVMKDPRLACVEVPIRNGMAYTGALPPATIGAYVDLWTSSPHCVHINEDGLSLLWFISGSPLSGANACNAVWEDGTCRRQSPFDKFLHAGMEYGKSASKYQRIKQEIGVVPYTLDEAAEWVEQQLTPETYRKAIARFTCSLHARQMEWTVKEHAGYMRHATEEADGWRRLYVDSVLRAKIGQVRQLVEAYRQEETRINERIEQINAANDALKAQFPRRMRGTKEYNTPFHRNNKEIEKLRWQLYHNEDDVREQLFPKSPLSEQLWPHFSVDDLVTMETLTRFLDHVDGREEHSPLEVKQAAAEGNATD